MSYETENMSSFCGGTFIHNVTLITDREVKTIQRIADGTGRRPFVLLCVGAGTSSYTTGYIQTSAITKFKKAGWKPFGAKFANKRSGRTMQMYTYTPVKNRNSDWY
jgi:hypothetical protein